ncbi:copper chaperone PCu(A)C [Photobacterium alginatilyticum]|uniref:Copper chaperone PCu(A)C n=1 Tax=Photobacterium alginatilyticum TaxID=1775171 RepID=A0ABW9YQ50_9GAMM|nr:copper chaperone PCu(A)C [Photobacterium alginatilyticum]NBI55525.1 copper chaperone PCu(A)C [Photobacterium alginatilyticum]
MNKLVAILGLLFALPVFADVTISDCVIVEPAPGVSRTALFFNAELKITDEVKAMRTPSPEAILGADIPALSNRIEMHKTEMKDGVMKMQRIPKLFLKKDGVTKLQKGGLHFMLMDLHKRPVAGETYPVTLWLTYLSDQSCEAKVVKASVLTQKP